MLPARLITLLVEARGAAASVRTQLSRVAAQTKDPKARQSFIDKSRQLAEVERAIGAVLGKGANAL